MTKTAPVVIDTKRYKVFIAKKPVETLTPKEFDLLKVLAQADGIVLSREDILERVWGYSDNKTDSRTVDQHVARLRRKLGKHYAPTSNRAHGLNGIVTTVATRGYCVEGVKVL